jgi:hypothetical protein
MSLATEMIRCLKAVANVPVYTDSKPNVYEDAIMISTTKLADIVSLYGKFFQFTSTAWSNLPDPPECEKAFVIAWMIASESYDVNHFSIKWSGSNPNTFVHLWAIINRLRTVFDTNTANWFINSRDPVGYCNAMNMTGPADQHIYVRETIMPHHIKVLEEDERLVVTEEVISENASYVAFRMGLMVSNKRRILDISELRRP